jgi:hypothetical protein
MLRANSADLRHASVVPSLACSSRGVFALLLHRDYSAFPQVIGTTLAKTRLAPDS